MKRQNNSKLHLCLPLRTMYAVTAFINLSSVLSVASCCFSFFSPLSTHFNRSRQMPTRLVSLEVSFAIRSLFISLLSPTAAQGELLGFL